MHRQGIMDAGSCDPPRLELETWIEAARRGDREALGHAMLSLRDYLLLVANDELDPALGVKGGASDLVQDTFVLAQRGFGEFRGRSSAEWRKWLRTILLRQLGHHRRRHCLTAKRQQAREVPIHLETTRGPASRDQTPSRDLARREREAALFGAMERLPEHYREIVIWHHRDREPFEEIGRRRGISADAARKLWARALGRLRLELGPELA
jgi:RNA polymerase sigma-70 factor, ECF subfamily